MVVLSRLLVRNLMCRSYSCAPARSRIRMTSCFWFCCDVAAPVLLRAMDSADAPSVRRAFTSDRQNMSSSTSVAFPDADASINTVFPCASRPEMPAPASSSERAISTSPRAAAIISGDCPPLSTMSGCAPLSNALSTRMRSPARAAVSRVAVARARSAASCAKCTITRVAESTRVAARTLRLDKCFNGVHSS